MNDIQLNAILCKDYIYDQNNNNESIKDIFTTIYTDNNKASFYIFLMIKIFGDIEEVLKNKIMKIFVVKHEEDGFSSRIIADMKLLNEFKREKTIRSEFDKCLINSHEWNIVMPMNNFLFAGTGTYELVAFITQDDVSGEIYDVFELFSKHKENLVLTKAFAVKEK